VAFSAPEIVGEKATDAEQLAEAPRVEPQVVEVTEKSAALVPAMDPALRLTELEVPFETVMVCDALVDPVLMLPKDKLEGEAVTVVVELPPLPIPESETCCGLFPSLSV
jgi:hypothetical protein